MNTVKTLIISLLMGLSGATVGYTTGYTAGYAVAQKSIVTSVPEGKHQLDVKVNGRLIHLMWELKKIPPEDEDGA